MLSTRITKKTERENNMSEETKTEEKSLTNQLLRDLIAETKNINKNLADTNAMCVQNQEQIKKIAIILDGCPVINLKKFLKSLGIKVSLLIVALVTIGSGVFYFLKEFFGG